MPDVRALAGDDNGGASLEVTLGECPDDEITDDSIVGLRELIQGMFAAQFRAQPQSVIITVA